MARAILIGIVIGILSETLAYHRRLWVYRSPLYPVLNVGLMFGVLMGGVAMLAPALGLAAVFGVGFALGLAYELLNLAWLDWWYFPDDRLLWLRGREACAVGVALAWGAVPAAIASV